MDCCICSVFYDAFSLTKYVASDEKVINDRRIGKDLEGRVRGLVLNTIPAFVCRD
jgi:hypothetical protein